MDVTKECVEVFSWHRHGLSSLDARLKYVKNNAVNGLFKRNSNLKDISLKGKIVLDAGCGGGLKSCSTALQGAELVVGMDASPAAIGAAKELSQAFCLSNTRFIQGYLEDVREKYLGLNIPKADIIICAQVIHHTTDWKSIIKSFSEILDENGVLILAWLDYSINWGQYLWKNRIAFALGNDKESRLKIGRTLFGWWDKQYNTTKLEENSFFADRYSAFYRNIPYFVMQRKLKKENLDILETYPPISSHEWARQRPESRLSRLINNNKVLQPIFTFSLRILQFVCRGGGERLIYCMPSKAIRIKYR